MAELEQERGQCPKYLAKIVSDKSNKRLQINGTYPRDALSPMLLDGAGYRVQS